MATLVYQVNFSNILEMQILVNLLIQFKRHSQNQIKLFYFLLLRKYYKQKIFYQEFSIDEVKIMQLTVILNNF